MGVDERIDLLKLNIARHMKDLLGLDFIEIRLLDRETGRLVPLLTEGMTPLAANRELYARKRGQRRHRLRRRDRAELPLPGHRQGPALPRRGRRRRAVRLTVPLVYHGTVIGTLNVESPHPTRSTTATASSWRSTAAMSPRR